MAKKQGKTDEEGKIRELKLSLLKQNSKRKGIKKEIARLFTKLNKPEEKK